MYHTVGFEQVAICLKVLELGKEKQSNKVILCRTITLTMLIKIIIGRVRSNSTIIK